MNFAPHRCIYLTDIGKFIKEERTRRSLSQYELAKLANVSQATISFLENDIHATSMRTILQIIHVLNLSAEVTFYDIN